MKEIEKYKWGSKIVNARTWLENNKNTHCFPSRYGDKFFILSAIKELEKLGAKCYITNIHSEEWRLLRDKGEYADVLIVDARDVKTRNYKQMFKIFLREIKPESFEELDTDIFQLKWIMHKYL